MRPLALSKVAPTTVPDVTATTGDPVMEILEEDAAIAARRSREADLHEAVGIAQVGRELVGEAVVGGAILAAAFAFHVGLGARVAIKVPRVDDLSPGEIPEVIASFLDEGRTLKRLRHPAVVALFKDQGIAHGFEPTFAAGGDVVQRGTETTASGEPVRL